MLRTIKYENHVSDVRFHILTAMSTKMTVFCDVAPRSLVETSITLHGTTSQKTVLCQ
jgi:hypothetical protein